MIVDTPMAWMGYYSCSTIRPSNWGPFRADRGCFPMIFVVPNCTGKKLLHDDPKVNYTYHTSV